MNRQEGKPVVIVDAGGHVVDVQSMSHKAYTKSTEHGDLWVVHGETGRVLPYEGAAGGRFSRLEEKGPWFLAVLAGTDELPSLAASVPKGPAGVGAGGSRESHGGGPVDAGATLRALSAVIARRKAERPEGSYTTYLFESGEEKIRKKTGEEAIELVLARNRDELVSEAADLIYHLLVLLSQLDIPFEAVLEELHGRS